MSGPWRCVLMVPVEVTFEYATNISQARAAALKARDSYKEVGDRGQKFSAQLVSLVGPAGPVEEWASKQREKRDLAIAARELEMGPSIGGDDDGPRVA